MPIPTIYLIIAVVAIAVIFIFLSSSKSITSKNNVTEQDIIEALKSGNKVTAIKYYRQLHNVSLKEAKDAVEKMDI